MCIVDLEKALDRVPRIVLEWAMSKKEIPEVLVRSVMRLYEGAKTRVSVNCELSEEFEAKVGMHQAYVLSPFLSAVNWLMVCGSITKDGMSKINVDPCYVCSLRAKANSVLCLQCGKWIQDRCA